MSLLGHAEEDTDKNTFDARFGLLEDAFTASDKNRFDARVELISVNYVR